MTRALGIGADRSANSGGWPLSPEMTVAGGIGVAGAGVVAAHTLNERRATRAIDAEYVYPLTHGNRVELYSDYNAYVARLDSDLRSARQVIGMTDYNWEPSASTPANPRDPGERIASALKERSAAGIDVTAVTDKHGSLGSDSTVKELAPAYFDDLRTGIDGLTVNDPGLHANPLHQTLDHRKQTHIDYKTAWVKGPGLADNGGKYSRWNDFMWRLEGPVAAQVGADHVARFEDLGGHTSESSRRALDSALAASNSTQTIPASAGGSTARVLPNHPGVAMNATRDFFDMAASPQEKKLWVATPYIGSRAVADALKHAARPVEEGGLGRDVRVLVPSPLSRTNSLFLKVSRTFYDDLQRAGVQVKELDAPELVAQGKAMLHAKAWGTEDRVTGGSTNLSDGSLRWYHETSVAINDPKVAAQYLGKFTELWDASSTVDTTSFGRTTKMLTAARKLLRFQF